MTVEKCFPCILWPTVWFLCVLSDPKSKDTLRPSRTARSCDFDRCTVNITILNFHSRASPGWHDVNLYLCTCVQIGLLICSPRTPLLSVKTLSKEFYCRNWSVCQCCQTTSRLYSGAKVVFDSTSFEFVRVFSEDHLDYTRTRNVPPPNRVVAKKKQEISLWAG